jgi:hypothetical protein
VGLLHSGVLEVACPFLFFIWLIFIIRAFHKPIVLWKGKSGELSAYKTKSFCVGFLVPFMEKIFVVKYYHT